MEIEIRPATIDDLPGVERVARATWHATYGRLLPVADIESFLVRFYSQGNLSASLKRHAEGYFVAVAGEEVVGYASVGRVRDGLSELWNLYVLPAWQGQGLGRRLWQRATEYVRRRGIAELEIWAMADNASARRFYERQGAVLFEERTLRIGSTTVGEVGYRVALSPTDASSA